MFACFLFVFVIACSLSHDIFIDNNQNNLNDYGIDTSDVSISTSELRIWYQRLGVFRVGYHCQVFYLTLFNPLLRAI